MPKKKKKKVKKRKIEGTSLDGQDISKARYGDENDPKKTRIGSCALFARTGSMRHVIIIIYFYYYETCGEENGLLEGD